MAGRAYTRMKESGCLPTSWHELEPLFDEIGITPKFILESLYHIAKEGKTDRDRLKALDMLTKITGMKPPERILVGNYDNLKIRFEGTDGE